MWLVLVGVILLLQVKKVRHSSPRSCTHCKSMSEQDGVKKCTNVSELQKAGFDPDFPSSWGHLNDGSYSAVWIVSSAKFDGRVEWEDG